MCFQKNLIVKEKTHTFSGILERLYLSFGWRQLDNMTEELLLNGNKCLEYGYKLSRQNVGGEF